jgi:cation diffusion facilitator family transporter
MDRGKRFGMADQIIAVGFWVNAVLMVMKLLAGHFGHSEAVFADGMESACDFIAIVSTIVALKIGRKPFDKDHPYGHGKAECIAAIVVSMVIFVTGAGILYLSVTTIVNREFIQPQLMAVLAALATIIVKEILYQYTRRVADKIKSPAVEAIARDHRKDALTSVATVIGAGGAYFGFFLMDPLAAGLTSFFIFYIALKTFRGACHDLMDGQPPQEALSVMTGIAKGVTGVEHVHEIQGRCSSQYLIIDLKLEMDPNMTVKQSHAVATEVKRLIFDKFPNVGDIMIHINPHDDGAHEDLIRL